MKPDELKTFKLIKNSKNPTSEWRTKNFRINEIKEGQNLGAPTGRINGITVIDCDFYSKKDKPFDKKNSAFLKEFKKAYKKCFDTFAVKTPRGGKHFYFKYDEDIRQTANAHHQIDTRSDGGYIVFCGSMIDGKKYKIINNTDIKEIPKDLKEWLLNNLYVSKNKYKSKKKNGELSINSSEGVYKYNVPEGDMKEMLEKLPDNYWENFDDFFIYTTACKILNCFDIWDNINKTKKGYDYKKNVSLWNSAKDLEGTVINVLFSIDEVERINYYKYKPILENETKADEIINRNKLGYDFIKPSINYMIKSDTGTGKTTSLKHYIKEHDLNFISIVSRVSLGAEQSRTFSEFGIDTRFYKNQKHFKNGENIVITIDSVLRLSNIDFSKYVVFLDEFNSLIEYLITSTTLHKTRVLLFIALIKILNNCKQVVGADADISDISLKFLHATNKTYKFVKNEYLHNNGVKAVELFNFDDFVNMLCKEKKFLCCSDSKRMSEAIKKRMGKCGDNVKIITGETDDDGLNLDDYDRVIYSPKIVYGLDSSMKRPVYVYYKEHTITPTAMLQQIARCRNITKLWFLFDKKDFRENTENLENVRDYLIECNSLGCNTFGLVSNEEITELYMELLSKFEYNYGCFRTNKFAHFLKLLDERGFKRIIQYGLTNEPYIRGNTIIYPHKEITKIQMKIKAEKIENFDIKTEFNQRINEILKIPEEKAHEYAEYFIDNDKLLKHFNISKYLTSNKDTLLENLEDTEEFNTKKIRTCKSKILYLFKLRVKLGLKGLKDIKVNKIIDDEKERKEYFKEYNTIFRNRSKNATFDTLEGQQQYLIKIYDNIFGNNFVEKIRTQKNKKKIKSYRINGEMVEENMELLKYRQTKKEIETCLFD